MKGQGVVQCLRAAIGLDRTEAAAPMTKWRRLDEMAPGARVVLRALNGGPELNARFMQLGIVVGSHAEVLQSHDKGPMLIRARSTLVAIGRSEAGKIMVEAFS